MTTLAVIVITKNEARNIVACLQSVRFADQIVVLDSESTDGTAELAKSMGAELSQSADWPGFGIQKNRALALANCDWVLSIDADERITPELQAEIKALLDKPQFDPVPEVPAEPKPEAKKDDDTAEKKDDGAAEKLKEIRDSMRQPE